MNNAVYGKTMENVFNRKSFKLLSSNDTHKAVKLTKSPLFKKEHIISNDLVILELNKTEIVFDKPVYIGFSILELSKLHMYKLHYDVIKKKWENNATLMYMDTDSLIYEIDTEDVYHDMIDIQEFFDMSSYPPDSPYYSKINKGVLGTLKDEFANTGISDFICLRSKCYSLKTFEEEEIKKCKGIVKTELSSINHEDFITCAQTGKTFEFTQRTFRSVNHNIYTITTTKDGLTNKDSKRVVDLHDSNYTVPFGYDKLIDTQ